MCFFFFLFFLFTQKNKAKQAKMTCLTLQREILAGTGTEFEPSKPHKAAVLWFLTSASILGHRMDINTDHLI